MIARSSPPVSRTVRPPVCRITPGIKHMVAAGIPWVLAVLSTAASPCALSKDAAPPHGVRVSLELKDQKTDYLIGEPIDLRLVFSAAMPGYIVDATRYGAHDYGVHDQVNVTPQEQAIRWHGEDSSDHPISQALTAQGFKIDFRLNNELVFKTPGRYEISVTTKRLAHQQTPLRITTNMVVIHLAAMSEQEEAARVAALTARLATDRGDTRRYSTALRLACLVGDVAAREKVRIYLDPWQGLLVKEAMLTGLAISRNKTLELALLNEAWQATDRVPSEAILEEMITLRELDAGIPIRGAGIGVPIRAAQDAAHHRAGRAFYLAEIIKTLSMRDEVNRAQTQSFLERISR